MTNEPKYTLLPHPKEQIVYIQANVKDELPDKEGWYNFTTDGNPTSCGRAYFDDNFTFGRSSAVTGIVERGQQLFWLKPVPLSTLLDERVKELEADLNWLSEKSEDPIVKITYSMAVTILKVHFETKP